MPKLYFDTAYLAKCYWNEPQGALVRSLARQADGLFSSAICQAEMACVAHRKLREGQPILDVQHRQDLFREDLDSGIINAIPVTDRLLRRLETATRSLPATCYIRSCDALHLVAAADAGFREVWTNDRHMLAAASHFGLAGRYVEDSLPCQL